MEIVTEELQQITDEVDKARFIHRVVDEYNEDVFSHPIVQAHSPCRAGCSACCHTQVSVTKGEVLLLNQLVQEGLPIDARRLEIQASAGNDPELYYKIPFEDRKCVFLDEQGACRVYEDRPSVCRTNAVLGEASQCDTQDSVRPTVLVRTPGSDMVIYASFFNSPLNGSLPYLLSELLETEKESK